MLESSGSCCLEIKKYFFTHFLLFILFLWNYPYKLILSYAGFNAGKVGPHQRPRLALPTGPKPLFYWLMSL